VQTKVIEKNNKQRRCGTSAWRKTGPGFAIFPAGGTKREWIFFTARCRRFHIGRGNISLVARDSQFDLCLLYKLKSQVTSPRLLCTHTYVWYLVCAVSAYVRRPTPADMYTHSALWQLFPLLPVGPRTPAQNIYVRVNWTLGIDVMRRKIKIGKTGARTSGAFHIGAWRVVHG